MVPYLGPPVAWICILSFRPLPGVYPLVASAFAITPAIMLFADPMTVRLAVGIAVILCGLILVAA